LVFTSLSRHPETGHFLSPLLIPPQSNHMANRAMLGPPYLERIDLEIYGGRGWIIGLGLPRTRRRGIGGWAYGGPPQPALPS